MSRYEREPSSVMVRVPDFSADLQKAFEANVKDPPKGVTGLKFLPAVGYVSLPDGSMYILDSEGVGSADPILTNETVTLDIYYDGSILAIVPVMEAKFSPTEIAKAEYKEVPLHEFIRAFGRRLEENYNTWKNVLEGVTV